MEDAFLFLTFSTPLDSNLTRVQSYLYDNYVPKCTGRPSYPGELPCSLRHPSNQRINIFFAWRCLSPSHWQLAEYFLNLGHGHRPTYNNLDVFHVWQLRNSYVNYKICTWPMKSTARFADLIIYPARSQRRETKEDLASSNSHGQTNVIGMNKTNHNSIGCKRLVYGFTYQPHVRIRHICLVIGEDNNSNGLQSEMAQMVIAIFIIISCR